MSADGWTLTVCAVIIAVAVPATIWDWLREKYRDIVRAAEHITRTAAQENQHG